MQDEVDAIDDQIKAAERKIREISKKFEDGKGVSVLFTGEAFVTFETQEGEFIRPVCNCEELQEVLNYWNLGFFKRLFESCSSESPYKFRGNLLYVEAACEPSDVYWENAGIPLSKKIVRRTLSIIGSAVTLALFFSLILFINYQKVRIVAPASILDYFAA